MGRQVSVRHARFETAIRLIRRNIGEQGLSLALVAEHLAVSPREVERVFRDCAGTCYRDYVLATRMERARELLEQGRSARHVALLVGYSHGSGFAKAFRRVYGRSPSEYRRTLGRHATDQACAK